MELSQLYGKSVRECMGKIQTKIGKEELLAYLENNLCNLICISEEELGNRLLLAMAFHWELRRYDLAYIQEGVEIYFQILRFCLRQADKFQELFDDYELSVLLDEFRKLFSRPRVLLLEWDAEAEINAILFKINCDGTLKLRDIYRNLPYLSVFADQWFPPRYAMPVYRKVLKQMEWCPQSKDENDKHKENVAKAVKRSELWSKIRITGISLIVLSMLLILGLSQFFDGGVITLGKILSIVISIIIIILLGITFAILASAKIHFLKRFVPRLIACTIVGYIPLLLGDEAWSLALNLDNWTLPLICLGALLGGWVYLFIEVFNTIQRPEEATWRAFAVLSHTWAVSLGIGFLFNYVIGDIMVRHVLKSDIPQKVLYDFLPNVVRLSETRAIHPPVILAFSCVAVFIGIFLQILWHERTITDPL